MEEGGPDDPWMDRGSATLLCSSASAERIDEACVDLLVPSGAEAIDLLLVSLSGSAARRLDAIRERDVVVDRSAVTVVDDSTDGPDTIDRTYSVESVETVDRLSDLGMHIRDVVADWAYDGNPTVVCFDAVDDLIVRTDLEVTFEFFLVVVEGIRPWGAIAHFHFDPAEHEGETRRTIEPLFDELIGCGE